MVPNQENIWRVIHHFKATVKDSMPLQPQIYVQEHCPGETGLPSSGFQAVLHEMSLVHWKQKLVVHLHDQL